MTTRQVKSLGELRQSVPPARDLWPGIAAAIDEQKKADEAAAFGRAPARRRAWMPAAGMAAAVALVAIGVLIGRQIGTTPSTVAVATPATLVGDDPLPLIPAALRDQEYRAQRDALIVEVQTRLQTMQPQEREKVAASLATLRRSITEIEAALGHDPANALLQQLLVSSCQEEMRALTTVRDSGDQET